MTVTSPAPTRPYAHPASGTTLRLRAATDARPPAQLWQPPAPEASNQPSLLLGLDLATAVGPPALGEPADLGLARPAPGRIGGAPEVRAWSATLASAIMQVVQGQRPIAQLTRWVAERALAELALRRRQVAQAGHRDSGPAVLRSIRLQHPAPSVTEVCACLTLGRRTVPLAFRLELSGERWLCTAVELGPLPTR